MSFSQKEAIKEIREISTKNSLAFKRVECGIYQFVDKITREIVLDNVKFWTAYADCVSGYIDTYNQDSKKFKGFVL